MHECQALVNTDLQWIVEELRDLPKQSSMFSNVPDDPQWVLNYFQAMLNNGTLFGVVNRAKASFILGCITRPWYADRLEIHEMILWVPERFRGARTAIQLIRFFTELAMDYNPYCIHVGATLDISNRDRTLKLYELTGYSRDGPTGAIMRL